MKGVLRWLFDTLLIFAAVFCCVGMIVDGFNFEVSVVRSAVRFDVNTISLVVIWLIAAGILSALSRLKRGLGLIPGAVIIVGALIYFRLGVVTGLKHALALISAAMSRWLPVSSVFTGAAANAAELASFFLFLGLVLTLLLAISLSLLRSASFSIALTAPFLLLSVLLLDYQPGVGYNIGLIAVWLTLIFGGAMAPELKAKKHSNYAIPALLALMLLGLSYLLTSSAPPDRGELISKIDSYADSLFNSEEGGGSAGDVLWGGFSFGSWRFNTESSRVADAGRRVITNQTCLEVTVDEPGTYYLKGFSLPYFDGRAWTQLPDGYSYNYGVSVNKNEHLESIELADREATAIMLRAYGESFPEDAPPLLAMTVNKLSDNTGVDYLPYYSSYYIPEADSLQVIFYKTQRSLAEYLLDGLQSEDFYQWYLNSEAGGLVMQIDGVYDGAVASSLDSSVARQEVYTYIDPATKSELLRLATEAGIYSSESRDKIAEKVAEYVSGSASYSLNPTYIPSDEDFASYFIESAERGYCVHFATAATLMLRALDVPARFVNGFAVTVTERSAGTPVPVTDRQAHSWVEVFYDGMGWMPLEATPASGNVGSGEEEEPESRPSPSPSAGAQESEAPSSQTGGANKEEEPSKGPGTAFWITLGAVLLISAVPLRAFLLRRKRASDFAQEDTNAAVIAAWRYIFALYGAAHKVPEDIEELALKAKFSQHRLTEEERGQVLDYALSSAEQIKSQKGALGRFVMQYVRGL